MKTLRVSLKGITRVLGKLVTAGVLMGLIASCAPTGGQVEPTLVPEAWRDSMRKLKPPKKACFESTYPKIEWREVKCVAPPPFPMPPKHGALPVTVGNGDDISAQAPSGFISEAVGTFDSVTGVTSETGKIGNSGQAVADAYTLQVNTNFFNSTACAGSPNANCRGWEQFVFYNNGTAGMVFIQYWLLQYNANCPAGGWTQFTFSGGTDIYCYRNDSAGATPVPNQPITNLGQLTLSGTADTNGDSATFSTAANMYTAPGENSVNAPAGWQIAEFNVFGPGGNSNGGSEATFNSGSTIVPRTRITYGGAQAPNCVGQGFTGETNNLSFGPNAPAPSPLGPAVLFTESSAGGATPNCAAGTSVGDTHLATIRSLFYDFQASGDFLLAQVEPDFIVQARQVSGAPTWPDASVNSAVATQMGKTQAAVCLGPSPLYIDGKPTEVADGNSLVLDDGVNVLRAGNVYLIRDQTGNSVRAEINSAWINVWVGLGTWPVKVRGLLANTLGDVNQIETSDGKLLTSPFSFEDLYHGYADGWRVAPGESLLSVCGEEKERGIPQKILYANDLAANVAERTRAVCLNAGLKEGPLLDACTLDVAVIGDEAAAKVFVGAPTPAAVGVVRP